MKYYAYVQTLPGCPDCLTAINRLTTEGHTVEILDDERLFALPQSLRRHLGAVIHMHDHLPVVVGENELCECHEN